MSTTNWLDEEHTNLGGTDVVAYRADEILPTKEEMEQYATDNGIEIPWD